MTKTIQHQKRLQEIGEMTSFVAHEIRNSLGGIKGFAALLSRDLAGEPQLQQMADYILEGTENLNRLMTQVLNYSRPFEPHFETTDLASLLQEIHTLVQVDKTIRQNADIQLFRPAGELIATVDAELLRRAIINLIVNAVQAMPKGGCVKINLMKENNFAVIKIADDGEGIPPENLKKLFTPFFTTKPQGTGFGLAEVHKVIEEHHGQIDVQSKLQQGTTFTLKIPLKESHEH